MPWETKFDFDETLEKALKTFWEFGYTATSMQNLVNRMEINTGSIYRTYGNKRELFLSSLKYYNEISVKYLQKYEAMASPKQGLISFFEHLRDMVLDGSDVHGCFIVNTTLEMAPHDKEINDLVSKGQDITRKFFKNIIKKGQEAGEVSQTLNPNDTSELLLSLLLGVRVLTRNNPTKAQFNVVIKNVKLILAA